MITLLYVNFNHIGGLSSCQNSAFKQQFKMTCKQQRRFCTENQLHFGSIWVQEGLPKCTPLPTHTHTACTLPLLLPAHYSKASNSDYHCIIPPTPLSSVRCGSLTWLSESDFTSCLRLFKRSLSAPILQSRGSYYQIRSNHNLSGKGQTIQTFAVVLCYTYIPQIYFISYPAQCFLFLCFMWEKINIGQHFCN